MLEETYDKFKMQLKAKKTSNDNLPEIVYNSDQQVHHICSYNYYRIKDDDTKLRLLHNDVYNTDELTHEFEYGLFEDIVKSEQLIADLKLIDEYKETLKEQTNEEFDYFPMEEFKDAGVVHNNKDPELKLAAQAELYTLEQQVLQQQQQEKHVPPVSHVQNQQEEYSSKHECFYHVHTINCPVYVPYNDEKQGNLSPLQLKCLAKKMLKHCSMMNISMNGTLIPTSMKLTQTQKHSYMRIITDLIKLWSRPYILVIILDCVLI